MKKSRSRRNSRRRQGRSGPGPRDRESRLIRLGGVDPPEPGVDGGGRGRMGPDWGEDAVELGARRAQKSGSAGVASGCWEMGHRAG